jgi:hypothetical protein
LRGCQEGIPTFFEEIFLSCLPNALDFFSQTIGRGCTSPS